MFVVWLTSRAYASSAICYGCRGKGKMVAQSYIPSCSQTSTRKSTISARGIRWGKGLLLPSKLSYVAFQLNFGSRICCGRFSDLLFPSQRCLFWFHRRKPWFTNSEGLVMRAPLLGSRVWLIVLIDEMLPCDWTALLSISNVLLVQKSSEMLGCFLAARPWFAILFGGGGGGGGGSSTSMDLGLVWHARQPLLPCLSLIIRKTRTES